MDWVDGGAGLSFAPIFANAWFAHTAVPLFLAHAFWKQGQKEYAVSMLKATPFDMAPDWREAGVAWVLRRLERLAKNEREEQVIQ